MQASRLLTDLHVPVSRPFGVLKEQVALALLLEQAEMATCGGLFSEAGLVDGGVGIDVFSVLLGRISKVAGLLPGDASVSPPRTQRT